jgi:ATP-dependent DNA helicase DinG
MAFPQQPEAAATTQTRKLPTLHQFFAPGGLLSRAHPQYEFRRGQLQMAESVENALSERRHLIVEAGTGTGKTLAYLLPVIRSGKRVIISTGTKNLQEQLFFKDIPFLERQLFAENPDKLRVCYMKGRNNYLCRQKLYDLTAQPALTGTDEIEQYLRIEAWEKTTETGDQSELADLRENSLLWQKLDARTERCTGQECKQFTRCFITEMRRRMAESDIIVVNHHLFFADLKIRTDSENTAAILPEFDAVIFDEAHELEDVATSYFGLAVSNLSFEELARDIEFTLRQLELTRPAGLQALAKLRERARFFFELLPPGQGRFFFENKAAFLEENGGEYGTVMEALEWVNSDLELIDNKPAEILNFGRRIRKLRSEFAFLLEKEDANLVFWIERRGTRRLRTGQMYVSIQATPIDVSEILKRTLFENVETAVLTSATLAVAGPEQSRFGYVCQRVGLEHARELVVPSHFDYASQAILYVPMDLPDPRAGAFVFEAAEKIRQILDITQGRAFCLFTSYKQMHEINDLLAGKLPFPTFLQGQAPKNALLEEFRLTANAVLFATSSFWQGVDVQGEQLSCVIIDRLPFAVPNDPVVAARIRAIEENGGNAFFEYQVPAAVIALKQGFGRLIRSVKDRGLLALLDNRLLKQPYGRIFVESLPAYKRTKDLADVEQFFRLG